MRALEREGREDSLEETSSPLPKDSAAITRQVADASLPTEWGEFRALGFERLVDGRVETAMVLTMGDTSTRAPLVRIHSECLTGDVFGSQRCDCGGQLESAMKSIAEEGAGILIYEKQEGRGIGLMANAAAGAPRLSRRIHGEYVCCLRSRD